MPNHTTFLIKVFLTPPKKKKKLPLLRDPGSLHQWKDQNRQEACAQLFEVLGATR